MKKAFTLFASLLVAAGVMAQTNLTKEQILAMSTDELAELPLETLMQAVETLGVSSVDELFAMIMNKNVSSASKSEESTFTSPLSSSVVTHDELRTWGVTTIEEALRLIPGMIVTEKTNGVYDVQLRGLNNIPDNNMLLYTENSNTLVMIDGRPVHNYAMGAITFEMLPIDIDDIERIEVVRGASGALYGANAVTGVINIITIKPDQSDMIVSGSAQMGNNNSYLGSLALRKSVGDKFAFGITANFQRRNRPTSDLYVIPAAGLYYALSDDAPTAGSTFEQSVFATKLEAYGGSLRDFSNGGWVAPENLQNLRQAYSQSDGGSTYITLYDCLEPESPASDMFPNSNIARKSEGYNGYLAFYPAKDVRFDLTGGYQRSFVNSTPVGDDYFSFNGREIKGGYVALSADIKGLKVLANYSGGPQNYAVGVPGFKVYSNLFFASAEYDINVGNLMIRPGVFFQDIYYKDYVPDFTGDITSGDYSWTYHDPGYEYDETKEHLSGFFNYDAKMTSIAPAVRLDYKVGDLRLIAAYRTDKTNVPDKWNHSAQFSASYSINPENFVRVVYGHSNRAAVLVNSNANFRWTRTNLLLPSYLSFKANKDANLVSIDNAELGYRLKPNAKLLIDAEAFYSVSRDYSALMANDASISVPKASADAILEKVQSMMESGATMPQIGAYVSPALKSIMITEAKISCGVLPFTVKQFGVSLNVDWIISPKLIAKANLNFQKTLIDNYYQYSQSRGIQLLLSQASTQLSNAVMAALRSGMSGGFDADAIKRTLTEEGGYYKLTSMRADALKDKMDGGEITDEDSFNALNKYFNPDTEDGVENKATPNFYGMIGVMYKPIDQLNISAFANYIGERSYKTKYNAAGEDLSKRLTINMHLGYKPVDNCEIFINAHNLLNNKKREFVYCDEIGGLYTIGVNFGF